jgi:hypothetical protein
MKDRKILNEDTLTEESFKNKTLQIKPKLLGGRKTKHIRIFVWLNGQRHKLKGTFGRPIRNFILEMFDLSNRDFTVTCKGKNVSEVQKIKNSCFDYNYNIIPKNEIQSE